MAKFFRPTDEADNFVFNWINDPAGIRLKGGDDMIVDGSFADDRIFGGEGNDLIIARYGNDVIRGNEGRDHIIVQANQYLVAVKDANGVHYEFRGYETDVRGGKGHDVLTVEKSDGYTMTTDPDGRVHIELPNGGEITAWSVEEIHFL